MRNLLRPKDEDEAYVTLKGVVIEGQDHEQLKKAVCGDAASVVPIDTDIQCEFVSSDPLNDTVVIRYAKYGTVVEADGGQVVVEEGEGEGDGDGEGEEEEVEGAAGGDAGNSAATDGNTTIKEVKTEKDKGGKKNKIKLSKSVINMVSGPGAHVSTAKDAMGVRDFLVTCVRSGKKVGAGAIREVAHHDLVLHSARIFVGGSREDTMWERTALYMSVLPALKRRLRKHRIDFSWVDWHHIASTVSPNSAHEWNHIPRGQCPRGAYGPTSSLVLPAAWRCLEAVDKSTLPIPDGTHRPFALILIGNAPEPAISRIDEYLLQQRLPDTLPPPPSTTTTQFAATRKTPATADAKGAKGGVGGGSIRPTLVELVLARMGMVGGGMGVEGNARAVGRHLVLCGKSLDTNDAARESPDNSPRGRGGEVTSPTDKDTKVEPPADTEGGEGGEDAEVTSPGVKTVAEKVQDGFVVAGVVARVVCEPLCFVKEKAAVKNDIFAREVPATARAFFDADVCDEKSTRARRHAVDRVLALMGVVKFTPGVVSRYSLKFRSLAPRSGAGADKTLCWATVHLKGLPVPATGDEAISLEDYVGHTQLVLEAMHFELPTRVTLDEIDLNYSYLCNRGQNAVITYRGERAQLAAALATQKHQIRMASNVRVALKGCSTAASPQANALCDDTDMTLLDVTGIPPGTTEADVFAMFLLPLSECNVHANPNRCNGDNTGWAELIFDSNTTAFRIQKGFKDHVFKILRPSTWDDPLSHCIIKLTRADSDPVGYLKATGLPYNVTQADVVAFFDIRACPVFSTLRRDQVSAVLAMRHWRAAALLVTHFDRSRPWGLTGDRLAIKIVDPSSALSRVFASSLPFQINDKLQEPEKIAKDLLHKEKDLLQNMVLLPVRPIIECSQVFSREFAAGASGQDRKFGFDGEAHVTFAHEALGKMALAACGKDKIVSILNTPVKMSTAVVPRALCAAVEYVQEDLCKMMLASYTAVRTAVGSLNCSVLQCVAMCCSVTQCVAVCCSVLQCVAVGCSGLQWVGSRVCVG